MAVRLTSLGATLALLVACSSGPGGSGGTANPGPAAAPTASCPLASTLQVWPGQQWDTATPESLGICTNDLSSAIDYAFEPGQNTGAVLVIKNGYIIAERYANDRTMDDWVTSWSVGKSFNSALIGTAMDDGLISNLDQSMADFIPAWAGTTKADITLEHLLTLRTSLALVPGIYSEVYQLQVSIDRQLNGVPGDVLYGYSNSDVMLAGEVISVATGMNAHDYLLQRIGSFIGFTGEWWEDGASHSLTYCCIDATPRNFARFGLLFARSGEWDGTTVISSNWVNHSTASAIGGNYGYYWWPAGHGGFAAFGLHGQIISVYPGDDLVVLRFTRYTRIGDGRAVKENGNYHSTIEGDHFDNATFLNRVYDAVTGT